VTTLAQVNRAITNAGFPLELERGEGYHYFIYDNESAVIYETESVYVCYTNTYTPQGWVEQAKWAWDEIRKRIDNR